MIVKRPGRSAKTEERKKLKIKKRNKSKSLLKLLRHPKRMILIALIASFLEIFGAIGLVLASPQSTLIAICLSIILVLSCMTCLLAFLGTLVHYQVKACQRREAFHLAEYRILPVVLRLGQSFSFILNIASSSFASSCLCILPH